MLYLFYIPAIACSMVFHVPMLYNISVLVAIAHGSVIFGSGITWTAINKLEYLELVRENFFALSTSSLFLPIACGFQYIIGFNKSYKIFAILLGCFWAMQLSIVSVFLFTFMKHRRSQWHTLKNLENILTIHETFEDAFETTKKLAYWMSLSEENIITMAELKIDRVYNLLVNDLDLDQNGTVSYDEFAKFAAKHKIIDYDPLWKYLSDGSNISKQHVKQVLQDTAFSRRTFAFCIFTDYLVIRWISIMLLVVILGGAFVFIANILGYASAFSLGIDLFKIYILIITYSFGFMNDRINFIILMLVQRPYNIGDLILYNNLPYIVTDICLSNTSCKGTTSMVISNGLLTSQPILNMTSDYVTDHVILSLPINFVREIDMHACLQGFTELDPKSIRSGWMGVDSRGKLYQCNWTYNIKLHDRTRYLWLRTKIQDAIVASLEMDLAEKAILDVNLEQKCLF